MTKVAAHAGNSFSFMRRLLPFLIIGMVALLTVGIAVMTYRAKIQPAANPTPAPAAAVVASPAADKIVPEPAPKDESQHVRGLQTAPVTMEVYGDFQCPSCAHASIVIRELEKEYGDRLRVIFYEFPLAMHNHAVEAAMAAEAAAIQGKFWEMHDALYQYQGIWSKVSDPGNFFESYAELIGLDVARFRADRKSLDVQERVKAQGESGTARGVQNTPTIFINGTMMRNVFTEDKFREAIESALAVTKKS